MLPDEVDSGWEARRRLADAVRTLSERCVRTDVGEAELTKAEELVPVLKGVSDSIVAEVSFIHNNWYLFL